MIERLIADDMAILTLARPERGNALSESMVETLIEAVTDCIGSPHIHTLVLAADGRHFCTGFDTGEVPEAGAPSPRSAQDGALLWRFVRIEHLLALLWHAPLRTVAVAHGRTWGAGADLFATCDVRFAAADAQWRFPGVGFGLVLGSRRLGACVGEDLALTWLTEGRTLSAEDAVRCGLATALVPDAALWKSHLGPPAVTRDTHARLKAAMRPDQRDADLAALVRSAAEPGLAERIARYRQAVMAARS